MGWRNQCALFLDLSFIGMTRLEEYTSSGSGSYYIYHDFEFIPTKRSNYLVNNFFTCVDGYSCNPDNDPIHQRKSLAMCSLVADVWYTKEDESTVKSPDNRGINLLKLLASKRMRIRHLRINYIKLTDSLIVEVTKIARMN